MQENKISRERFDKAMVLYRNDVEIIKTLEELNWEASKGLVPNEDIIAEILIFEIESLRKEKNILKKYILEDEVWEKWGVELGDVHLLAKELKKTKGLYLELQKLR